MRQAWVRICDGWNALWFRPSAAADVRFARCMVALHALWFLLSRDYAAIAGLPVFWSAVGRTLRWRYLLFPGHAALEHVIQYAAVIALVCVVVGVYPRALSVVAALCLYHLAPLETIIWTASPFARGLTLSPLLLLVLACVPGTPAPVPAPSWQFGWPLQLSRLLVAQIYLFAAFAKAEASGLAWSSGASIRRWLLLFAVDDRWRHHAFGLWLAAHPLLCLLVGLGTVVLEWTFVAAVFSARARLVLVPVVLAFHVGIAYALSIQVGETWLVLTFVDFDRLRGWARRMFARRPAPYRASAASIADAALSGESESST